MSPSFNFDFCHVHMVLTSGGFRAHGNHHTKISGINKLGILSTPSVQLSSNGRLRQEVCHKFQTSQRHMTSPYQNRRNQDKRCRFWYSQNFPTISRTLISKCFHQSKRAALFSLAVTPHSLLSRLLKTFMSRELLIVAIVSTELDSIWPFVTRFPHSMILKFIPIVV